MKHHISYLYTRWNILTEHHLLHQAWCDT